VAYEALVRGTVDLEIIAGFSQAEFSIDCAAYFFRVAVILSVVLPPADGAETERVRNIESFETAAEAAHTHKCIHIVSDAGFVLKSRKYLHRGRAPPRLPAV
jgi:hypothetical protein